MLRGYRIIDADGHVMEPLDLWERYVDERFRHIPVHHRLLSGEGPSFNFGMWINGFAMPKGLAPKPKTNRPKYIHGPGGRRLEYAEAYAHWIAKGFSAESYLDFLELAGIDYMVLYPTAGLYITAVPGMDPKLADALCRAYNSWLHDFCDRGQGRLIGVGHLDTRDPALAAKEARRCVKELGFKAVYILPQMEQGTSLSDAHMGTLWATLEELNVPLGIHMGSGNGMLPAGTQEVGHLSIGKACHFPMENMIACLAMTSGGVLERHPNLKVVFLESSASWVPFWLWWLDDRWERVGENAEAPQPPSFYWRRQCYVSAEPDEPGLKYVKDFQGDDNIVAASDFPHPEDATFPHVMERLLGNPNITEETKRKILWDNPARLYHITE